MTEINLRTYIQEVDDLIEEGQHLEEAIAHCRHILKTYPKHIDTYRLLGKAYLESKRFGDAGDIFQRVLSAIPNDFVSHIGMAIIREDEGNLDAAIWHMERGSEAQPGNAAIEEELKRLIGKRDGIEPQRVRPTRGALARMYYHGELYSYAISELQIALEEDPDRPDLQLLLADTFWRTDKRLEAADLCGQILEKLPYCFLANQITAALLQASGKPEESAINLRRLIALDPYMAFIETSMDNPATIDSSAIKLERLDWTPGQPLPSSETTQPDWAASLGVDLRGEEAKAADKEAMPSWLKSPASPVQEGSPIHPFAGAKAPPGTEIPDWMREAGWVESSGEATEGPMEISESYEAEEAPPSPDRPLQPADLPSWLSEISPARVTREETTSISEPPGAEERFPAAMDDSQDLPEWIREITPSGGEEEVEPLEFAPEEEPELDLVPSEPEPSEPEFLEEPELEELEQVLAEDESLEDEIPDYPPWLEPSTPGATDTIVTWLGDKRLEDVSAAEDIPTWMRGTGPLEDPTRRESMHPEEEPATESRPEPTPKFEEIPEILKDVEEPIPSEEILASAIPLDEPAPEWLDEGADMEKEFTTEVPEQPEEAPDWLTESTMKEEEVHAIEEATPPSWLEDFDEEFEEETREELGKPEEVLEPLDQPPDWLSEVIREDIPEGDEIEEKPEWLEGVVEADSIMGEEIPPDLEETPDWLTEMSLVEEVDTSPTAEEKEEQPEWLKGLADTEISAIDEEPTAEEVPPEWVTEESFPEPDEEIVASQETPEWLRDLSEPSAMVEEPSDIEATPPSMEVAVEPIPEEETPAEDETPDWLMELDQEEPLEAEAVVDEGLEELVTPTPAAEDITQAEIPEWLKDIEEAPIETEAIVEEPTVEIPEPSIEEEVLPADEAPIWLEGAEEPAISVEPVAEETVQDMPSPPDEMAAIPAEEAPDWLQDMVEAPADEVAIEEPLQDITGTVTGEELPSEAEAEDWLKEIREAPSQIEPTAEQFLEEIFEPAPSKPDIPEEEAPIGVEDIEEREPEVVPTSEEEFGLEQVPEEFKEMPEDLIPVEPTETAIPSDMLVEVSEGMPEGEALTQETPEWLQEIEQKGEEAVKLPLEGIEQIEELTLEVESPKEEIEEEPQWHPEFTKEEAETEIGFELIEEIEAKVPEAALEESFDWLEESALEVTPEPEGPPQPVEPSYTREQVGELIESIEDPLDDDEVFSFLEGLAAREDMDGVEVPTEEPSMVDSTLITDYEEEKLIEDHGLPEELDESLDWLEQLAGEEPVEDFSPPIFVEGLEEEEEAEIPDWLEEVAEKPERTPMDEIGVEEIKPTEEITEEPTPPISQLSSMETIISKRPTEEEVIQEETVEELPEEKLAEPLPPDEAIEEIDEWVWEREIEEEPPIAEEPAPIVSEPDTPVVGISEFEPEVAYQEVSPDEVESREAEVHPTEEPTMDPHKSKLIEARRALESGEIEEALGHYSDLIEEKVELESTIQDLKTAIEKTPREPMLWQILGDALMKAGQLSDAIDAYRRGMEAV
jgi:tetratricopeptide (TPR) repeat protein